MPRPAPKLSRDDLRVIVERYGDYGAISVHGRLGIWAANELKRRDKCAEGARKRKREPV